MNDSLRAELAGTATRHAAEFLRLSRMLDDLDDLDDCVLEDLVEATGEAMASSHKLAFECCRVRRILANEDGEEVTQ